MSTKYILFIGLTFNFLVNLNAQVDSNWKKLTPFLDSISVSKSNRPIYLSRTEYDNNFNSILSLKKNHSFSKYKPVQDLTNGMILAYLGNEAEASLAFSNASGGYINASVNEKREINRVFAGLDDLVLKRLLDNIAQKEILILASEEEYSRLPSVAAATISALKPTDKKDYTDVLKNSGCKDMYCIFNMIHQAAKSSNAKTAQILVNNGHGFIFAVLTERINPDRTIYCDTCSERYEISKLTFSYETVWKINFLREIFTTVLPDKALFRLLLFVINDSENLSMNFPPKMTAEEIKAWFIDKDNIEESSKLLPSNLKKHLLNANHFLRALVFEYQASSGDKKLNFLELQAGKNPGSLVEEHINKAPKFSLLFKIK